MHLKITVSETFLHSIRTLFAKKQGPEHGTLSPRDLRRIVAEMVG